MIFICVNLYQQICHNFQGTILFTATRGLDYRSDICLVVLIFICVNLYQQICHNFQGTLLITATRGSDYMSDICLDDIHMCESISTNMSQFSGNSPDHCHARIGLYVWYLFRWYSYVWIYINKYVTIFRELSCSLPHEDRTIRLISV